MSEVIQSKWCQAVAGFLIALIGVVTTSFIYICFFYNETSILWISLLPSIALFPIMVWKRKYTLAISFAASYTLIAFSNLLDFGGTSFIFIPLNSLIVILLASTVVGAEAVIFVASVALILLFRFIQKNMKSS